MGYNLNAFLGRPDELKIIETRFRTSKVIQLTSDIALIPMTEELFDEINNYRTGNDIGRWQFLTGNVEKEILALVGNDMVAYFEVDYFGGVGGQSGIIWKERTRIFEMESQQDVVNAILRQFGVVKEKGKRDEFDTVGLGRQRKTEDWISETE
ncbi:hypothetical protein [Parachryseolinea silvisoli]|uniref:hypothetical protein n=1 Tax=Parachryseolinea silvisoli TaxID=2873601 RepID=UPI002265B4F3|nr:hypothetical protein [Parachryseolinea silvisoli]MCD9017981.1 hypothetical protein [Parachryseolinea silvisoli]